MKNNNLCIKVPVYMTTPVSIGEDEMFGGTYEEMIQNLKNLLDSFSEVSKSLRNKTKRTVIDKIVYKDCDFKGVPALLLRINAYSTNMNDGYYESENQREELGSMGRVGSNTNFVLMYPQINGIHPDSRSCSFYMLVYEDPTKDPGSVSHLAKTVAKDILHQPVHHVKPESVMETVKKLGTLPELQITYVGVSFDDDGDSRFKSYRSSIKIKETKEETFLNVPSDLVDDLANKQVDTGRYQNRYVKLIAGKKLFKLSKRIGTISDEDKERITDTAEMIFNMSTTICQADLDSNIVHNEDFVVEKLSGVLDNLLSYAE